MAMIVEKEFLVEILEMLAQLVFLEEERKEEMALNPWYRGLENAIESRDRLADMLEEDDLLKARVKTQKRTRIYESYWC